MYTLLYTLIPIPRAPTECVFVYLFCRNYVLLSQDQHFEIIIYYNNKNRDGIINHR
jgi:hypothetical protein